MSVAAAERTGRPDPLMEEVMQKGHPGVEVRFGHNDPPHPDLPQIRGFQSIAGVTLSYGQPQEFNIMRVEDKEGDDYLHLMAMAKANNWRTGDFVIFSHDRETGQLNGAAFLPTFDSAQERARAHDPDNVLARSVLGREGSLDWYDYRRGVDEQSREWVPFADNSYVSRGHAIILTSSDSVTILPQSPNETVVKAPKIVKRTVEPDRADTVDMRTVDTVALLQPSRRAKLAGKLGLKGTRKNG